MTKQIHSLIIIRPHSWTGSFNWLHHAIAVTRKVRRLVTPMVSA